MGYEEKIDCSFAIDSIKQDVVLGNFIYSNLKEVDHIFTRTILRFTSVLYRLRLIVYQIMIVSLT